MKIFSIIAVGALVLSACSSDDSVIPDAGEAGADVTTGNDATQDTTQQDTTPPSDAPGDTTVSDSPSDAPSDAPSDGSLLDALTNHCTDGKVDFDETDVDCGGLTCNKCISGKKCLVNTDCVSGTCKGNKTCM
jgi:hypothetical protein